MLMDQGEYDPISHNAVTIASSVETQKVLDHMIGLFFTAQFSLELIPMIAIDCRPRVRVRSDQATFLAFFHLVSYSI